MKVKSVKFYQDVISKQYLIKIKFENGRKKHTYFGNYEKTKNYYLKVKE